MWLADCNGGGCTTSPIEVETHDFGPSYVGRDIEGLFFLYEDTTLGRIFIGRETAKGWTVAPFQPGAECASLVSIALQPDRRLGLLCQDGDGAYFIQRQNETGWRQIAVDVIPEYSELTDQSLAFGPNGYPFLVVAKYMGISGPSPNYDIVSLKRENDGSWREDLIKSFASTPVEAFIAADYGEAPYVEISYGAMYYRPSGVRVYQWQAGSATWQSPLVLWRFLGGGFIRRAIGDHRSRGADRRLPIRSAARVSGIRRTRIDAILRLVDG